ncbi:hypothetical protein [Streptomyces sp. NPDC056883]|uniref:hypothetical protein n=1 Tax=Streptomyces sp. NPDC056883 TaxID=3345959 RepID=UPI00368A8F20
MNPSLVSTVGYTAGVESRSGRRPVRSRVRHGSPSCADYGCTREVCKAAARRDRARRTSELRAGRPARIPASQAAAHARGLREVGGLSAGDIAALSGISVTLVRRILREPEGGPDIHRTTADAILGVALAVASTRHRHRHRLPGLVGTDKAAACLQTLSERGWPTSFLAQHLATSTQTIAAVRGRKRRHLTLVLDQRIRTLYSRLVGSDPAEYGIAPHRSHRAITAARHRAE